MYISPINLLWTDSQALKDFEQTASALMCKIDGTIEKSISDKCIQIACKYGIDINKEDLIAALKADRARYEEAYQLGYKAGKLDTLRELKPLQNTDMWEVPDND